MSEIIIKMNTEQYNNSFNWFILNCIGLWQHPPAVSGPWSLQPSGRYYQPNLITGIPKLDMIFCGHLGRLVSVNSLSPSGHQSFPELTLNIIKVICIDNFCTDFEWIWVKWGEKVQNHPLIHPYLWSSQLLGVWTASPSWLLPVSLARQTGSTKPIQVYICLKTGPKFMLNINIWTAAKFTCWAFSFYLLQLLAKSLFFFLLFF